MREIDDYINRITRFHRRRPKYRNTVSGSLQPLVDTQNFLEGYSRAFDLDPTIGASGFDSGFSSEFTGSDFPSGAIGAQLDIDGEHINLSRFISVPLPDPWFRWGDANRGWGAGQWKQPFDPGVFLARLGDEDYRRLLKTRIAANHWDGTASQAREILRSYFYDSEYNLMVEDRQTMAVIFAISGRIPSALELEIFDGEYLPLKAAGVTTYHLVTTVDEAPIFGWGINNSAIGGWGSGAWGNTPRYVIDQRLTE